MSVCPQCGQENKEESKFCVKCGASLGAPAQVEAQPPPAAAPPPPQPPATEAAPPQQAAPAAPPPPQQAAPQITPPAQPPQAVPPTYQQPAQYAQPTPPPGAYAQQPYATSPATPYPAAYAQKTKSGLFWVGASITLLSGVMILASSFMAWIVGPFGIGSFSGWDLATNDMVKISNGFFDYADGYPMFSGLCPLILGILIAIIAVLMLLFRSKGLGGIVILFSIFALGIAITNLTSILRDPTDIGLTVGAGIYIFLIFGFAGLVGGGISMSG